jgi:cell division protein FtsQ
VSEERVKFVQNMRRLGGSLGVTCQRSLTAVRARHPVATMQRAWQRVMARKTLAAVITVLVLATAGGVVLASGAIDVRRVEVVGASRATAARIDTIAQSAVGAPMLTVNTSKLSDRVAALPQISGVHIDRSWPNTLRVVVSERQPLMAVHAGSGWVLIDRSATPYLTVATLPAHVLTLTLPTATASPSSRDPGLHAAVDVAAALPAAVRASVVGIEAPSTAGIRLRLRDGSTVVWGDPEDSARKARALAVLLHATAPPPGAPSHKRARPHVYDVSTPGFVTTS